MSEAIPSGSGQVELDLTYPADRCMTIPGQGQPAPGCGTWSPMQFCNDCGEPHFGQERCDRRSCPDCWGRWARDRAESMTVRLGAARYIEEGLDRRTVHAVVSPPEDAVTTLTGVSRGFRRAYELAKEKGVRGGVAIFHGWRATAEAKARWGAETDGGEAGPKLWRWIRAHDDWRALARWSPHYHIIGLCADFSEDKPDEQGGWVVRRIRSLKPFRLTDPEGYQDMIGLAVYQLSHAGFEKEGSTDCVRWFGELATSKFSVDRAVEEGLISSGAVDVIERYTAEALERGPVGDGEGGGSSVPECKNCGAEGSMAPIWDARRALQSRRFCERIGSEQQRRLLMAFRWAIGEVVVPSGFAKPPTREEAELALEELVDR